MQYYKKLKILSADSNFQQCGQQQSPRFSCPVCPQTFVESPELYEHLKEVHKDACAKIKQPKGREGKTTRIISQIAAMKTDQVNLEKTVIIDAERTSHILHNANKLSSVQPNSLKPMLPEKIVDTVKKPCVVDDFINL